MVKTYQPEIDLVNLKPNTKVKYWRNLYQNGTLTISHKDTRPNKMNNIWYFTTENIRICYTEIMHVY